MPLTDTKNSHINLYSPFTDCVDNAEYIIRLRDFIKNLPLFNQIPDESIVTTNTYVRFHLDSLGMYQQYFALEMTNNNIRVSTNVGYLLNTNTETTYANCNIFTLVTDNTSGFWFHTPTYGKTVKIFFTRGMQSTGTSKIVMFASVQNTNITGDLYIHHPYTTYENMSSFTGKSVDINNIMIQKFIYSEYMFPDLYVLSGNSEVPFDDAMIFNDEQYFQLSNYIYIKIA